MAAAPLEKMTKIIMTTAITQAGRTTPALQ